MHMAMALAMAMMMVAGMAAADDGSKLTGPAARPAKQERPKKPRATKIMGVVTAVNAAAGTLSIKGKKHDTMDFTVPANARIMKHTTLASLADVSVGDQVMVGFTIMDDVITVRTVKVRVAAAAKKSGTK